MNNASYLVSHLIKIFRIYVSYILLNHFIYSQLLAFCKFFIRLTKILGKDFSSLTTETGELCRNDTKNSILRLLS